MKNKSYRYDDNYKYSIVMFLILLILSILPILVKDDWFILIFTIIFGILSLLGLISIVFSGIHFNSKRGVIYTIDTFGFGKINIKDIQYVSFKELVKPKGTYWNKFVDDPKYLAQLIASSKYVYNNGKTFTITFHMKDKREIDCYYGWLYDARSKKRVNKQETKLLQFIDDVNEEVKKYR